MFGIELLAVPYMVTQIGFAECERHKMPEINLQTIREDIIYDVTKSHNQLEQFSINTVSPYEAGVHSKISGLMSGDINVSMTANIAWSTHPISKDTCMWYDKVNLTMTSSPTIYIASEHNQDRCRYNATLRHEMKHIAVDEALMRKYRNIFDSEIRRSLRQNAIYGPFNANQIEAQRASMNQDIQKTIERILADMKAERREKQQRIDSKHEYDHLSRLCGGR